MADIEAPLVRGLVALRVSAEGIEDSGTRGLAAINFPSEEVTVPQLRVAAVTEVDGDMEASQVMALGAVRGRIQNPTVRAWTFSLDHHDFYVLRLGSRGTLVYDLTTQQWSTFTSQEYDFWRANKGFNWIDALGVAHEKGSNVLVGDDTYGILWFLDPNQGYDDDVNRDIETPKTFPRVATGQIVAKSREYQSCFEVYLTGSNGYPSFSGATVDLSYSDDAGNNYVSAGPIEVEEGNYNQELSWMSLGRFTYPGRLFRIEDNGALARIDGMDINHES